MRRGKPRVKINSAMLNRIADQKDTTASKYDTDEKPANNGENDDIEYQQVNYSDGSSTHKVWDGRVPPFPQFPNQSRYAPRPDMPHHYTRGAKTMHHVNRIFKYQGKGRDKPLLELDTGSEDRIWIDQADIGLIVGKYHARKEAMEDEFKGQS